jgi:hypothetical protein
MKKRRVELYPGATLTKSGEDKILKARRKRADRALKPKFSLAPVEYEPVGFADVSLLEGGERVEES